MPQAAIQYLQREKPEEWRKLTQFDAARSLIHFLLVTPEIEAFSIDSQFGRKEPIDRNFLRSSEAVSNFIQGFKSFDMPTERTAGRYFFVNRSQFEDFLADRPIVNTPETQPSDNVPPSYIPPYIQFMLKATVVLELSSEKRTDKKVIVNWLEQNWPDELGEKSARMIDSMATFLRRPEDKKGGNTPWE